LHFLVKPCKKVTQFSQTYSFHNQNLISEYQESSEEVVLPADEYETEQGNKETNGAEPLTASQQPSNTDPLFVGANRKAVLPDLV